MISPGSPRTNFSATKPAPIKSAALTSFMTPMSKRTRLDRFAMAELVLARAARCPRGECWAVSPPSAVGVLPFGFWGDKDAIAMVVGPPPTIAHQRRETLQSKHRQPI